MDIGYRSIRTCIAHRPFATSVTQRPGKSNEENQACQDKSPEAQPTKFGTFDGVFTPSVLIFLIVQPGVVGGDLDTVARISAEIFMLPTEEPLTAVR